MKYDTLSYVLLTITKYTHTHFTVSRDCVFYSPFFLSLQTILCLLSVCPLILIHMYIQARSHKCMCIYMYTQRSLHPFLSAHDLHLLIYLDLTCAF